MRQLLFILIVAAGSMFISCNEGGMSATAKKNLEVNDAITKAFEAGDFAKVAEYISEDAIDHAGPTGEVKGRDSIIAAMKGYLAMMPDMKSVTIKSMADDEHVITWATMEGTMNGQKLKMTTVDIAKFKDGKAVEHWMYMDPKDAMMMMPADSTHMMEAPKPAEN